VFAEDALELWTHDGAGALDPVRSLGDVVERVRARSGPVLLAGIRGAAGAVIGARLVEALGDRPALFLAAHSKRGDLLLEDLRTALGEPPPEEGGRVRPFPRHDTPPYDRFSPQPFVTAQRMDVLHRLLDPEPEAAPVVVAPWTALALRVPARSAVRARARRVEVGQAIDREAFVAALALAGYARQPLVEERGEFAVRGGVVDFFPPQRARPVRLELCGDQVESIREFDPASQRSEAPLPRAVAPPARELLFDRELIVTRGPALRALAEAQGVAPRAIDELLDALLRGSAPPGAEALLPLLQPAVESAFDFLPEDALVVVVEWGAGRDRLLRYAAEAIEHHEAARAAGRPACPPDACFLRVEEIEAEIARRRPVLLESLDAHAGPARDPSAERFSLRALGQEELARELREARGEGAGLAPLLARVRTWHAGGLRVVLAAQTLSGADRLAKLLAERGLEARLAQRPEPFSRWADPGAVEVRVAPLSAGFVLPAERVAVATEEEIFGPRGRRRRAGTLREVAAIAALAQLAPGDLLVHAEHGIGVYRGLVPLAVDGFEGEFLRIEYEGGDRLFVPVHRLNLVQRYVGGDGAAPALDRLGGQTWARTKADVRKALHRLARELLAVHAEREVAPGFAFSPRDAALREFEAAFPYEETPDQAAAIDDVLADLARPRPMDRLVCGDVGYGKTEVAARAAFRVVMDGKQVAVLAPTTVLCQQHLDTFTKRFADWPVRIESLSRFRTQADARKVLEGLASGAVDVVIGTHRLLQKNVAFRDLGLVVVDEEHRFGVAHKERLKQLERSVDVLTLTATPIPRTLQMAFSGLRDLSVIHTPPPDRLSIRTQVCRFDASLVREAILREVRRGGQVFFVYNRVQTIAEIADLLRRIVPEARVIVAHGQMRERELEDRMLAFLRGDADVLLCTTIIESGLDMPRVNTILIDRADALGLAQLYQLRGRVGRGRVRAYAYLMIPGEQAMTADARRRLEAIQDLAELGSGFRLANMDLEIRGAGDLLGREQSGHLVAVGYETYMELLEEAIDELRGAPRAPALDPEIRLPVAARLPEEYVPEVSQRLVLYKRLAGAADPAEVDRIRDELLDRCGALPPEAENLLEVIRLKLAARDLGVPGVDFADGALVLRSAPGARIDPARLVDLLNDASAGVRLGADQRIHAPVAGATAGAIFARARWLLAALGPHPGDRPPAPDAVAPQAAPARA
jgi:transcription-repair coupling factor (superfamily II helicase)